MRKRKQKKATLLFPSHFLSVLHCSFVRLAGYEDWLHDTRGRFMVGQVS